MKMIHRQQIRKIEVEADPEVGATLKRKKKQTKRKIKWRKFFKWNRFK